MTDIAQIGVHLSSCLRIDLLARGASQHLDCPCLVGRLLCCCSARAESLKPQQTNCNLDEKKTHKNICCAGALRLMGIVPAQHAKETGPNTLHFTVNLESIFWGIDVLKGTSGLWHEMNCVLGESTSWAWRSQNKIPKNLQRLGIWHAANLTA